MTDPGVTGQDPSAASGPAVPWAPTAAQVPVTAHDPVIGQTPAWTAGARVGADQVGPAGQVIGREARTASASWNEHESPSGTPASQAPGKRTGRVLRQIWWTSVPIWSMGLLSFVPFLAFAVIHRRSRDWAVFAGYLAATVALVIAVSLVDVNSDAGTTGVGVFGIALAVCAAIHAGILFRPGRAEPALAAAARRRNQEAVQGARSRIERRNDARRIVQDSPALARELRIGRPDLPRKYNDGGLVDVNHVPATVLAAQLGLTQQEVTNVIAARDKLGGFSSADELRGRAGLSPGRVDELRDLIIFS